MTGKIKINKIKITISDERRRRGLGGEKFGASKVGGGDAILLTVMCAAIPSVFVA